MHSVGRIDWSFGGRRTDTAMSRGLARSVLVGASDGAVHLELVAGALAPGGWLATHLHAYEEALLVVAGELSIEIDGHAWRLGPGEHALVPVGTWHALANHGSDEVRWVGVNTPQRRGPESGRSDTWFEPAWFDPARLSAAVRPEFGSPAVRHVGRNAASEPAAGIAATPLVDRAFGADLLAMLGARGAPGGDEEPRDHPYEEAFAILEGTVAADLDGTRYELGAGEFAFAAVGCLHAFHVLGDRSARWVMAQAPQPPLRHAARFPHQWERFEAADRRR